MESQSVELPPHGDEVYSVGLEGVQFTLVDVHEGADRAFHEWYESDHFYAGGTLIPWVLAGRRWYAGRRHREARFVGARCPFPEPDRGTNLAMYWLTAGGLEGFRRWIAPQLVALRSRGRMFAERTHVNTSGYAFSRVIESPGSPDVAPHVALDHGFASVLVVYATPGQTSAETTPAPDRSLILAFDHAAAQLGATELGGSGGLVQPDLTAVEPVTLLLAFSDSLASTDADEVAEASVSTAAAAGLEALWGGTFAAVRPGSIAHLAELR